MLVGQDKRPEACLPPAHLALRTHSICGPHPGPGLIPGWQQPGEQKVYLSASAAPPSPASARDPSQGLLRLPGPGLSVAMAPAGDEALGGRGGGAGRAARVGGGPELCSSRGAGAPAGAGLDPEHSGPVAEPATHLA